MSLHQYDNVNSTAIVHEDTQSLLTPGQIALITITTTFVFYLTIMFLVCMGEYCKYVKRKKDRMEYVRRRHHSGTPGHDSRRNTRTIADSSIDQSDYVTSTSPNSDSSFTDRHLTTQTECVQTSTDLGNDVVEVHFEESLDKVNIDCVDSCDASAVNIEGDIVMLPLISRQCEETLDAEVDIYCDSPDSRTLHPLEADV